MRRWLPVSAELWLPSAPQVLSSGAFMGDSCTIGSLVATHRGELVAFAEKRVGSRALAEDLVQQASLRAVGGVQDLRDLDAGRAWLLKITRRVIADHFRARPEAGQVFGLSSAASDDFGCACVLANLHELKPEFAQVLRRVVVDGTPLAALASELGLSYNAATVRLSRARAALREQLREHCGADSLRECLDCGCQERGCCEDEKEVGRP
jgi:DNA-directed RNA polymerase specialized sigma24 family protein